MTENELEGVLAWQMKVAKVPEPQRNYRFTMTRRWRFDFAWPGDMVAVEVEGGIWDQGRHVRGKGYEQDCQKYNQAALESWRVLRFTVGMIQSGEALRVIEQALGVRAT